MSELPPNAGSLIGERLGKYDILALLALGGTGEVYLARIGGAAGFEKYVVVKCLHDYLADDAEFVRMFLDEARLGAQLDHSNIVQTLELGEHHGRYYMVMEYLAGLSMATLVKKAASRLPGGRLPVDIVLGLAAQACAGLHYTHERSAPDGMPLQMVHRDISPQNLVVSFEGILKLVDFGIAKAALRETHTKSGTIKGKFAYMSPEQCLAKDVDRRTDIFALGTIVWELLTGQRLFKRASAYATYQAIVNGETRPPSSVNHELEPALDEVVMRALAYDRDQRYPTAEAFGEALVGLLHRRGHHVGSSDVARFFDQAFAREIDEHARRMRELIEGRPSTIDDMTWDADPDSDAAMRMPDEPEGLGEDSSVVDELSGLEELPDEDAPDEDAGEATRIEPNPMARFEELDRARAPSAGAPPRPSSASDATAMSTRRLDSELSAQSRRATAPVAARGPADRGVAPRPRPVKNTRPMRPGSGAEGPTPTPEGQLAPARPGRPTSSPSAPTLFNAPPPAAPTPAPAEPPPAARGTGPGVPYPSAASIPPDQAPARGPLGPGLDAEAHRFPPLQTPSAFHARPEILGDGTPPGAGDLAAVAAERAGATPSPLLLTVAFVLATALGIVATLLIGALAG